MDQHNPFYHPLFRMSGNRTGRTSAQKWFNNDNLPPLNELIAEADEPQNEGMPDILQNIQQQGLDEYEEEQKSQGEQKLEHLLQLPLQKQTLPSKNNNYQNQLKQAKRDSLLYHISGNKDGILKEGFNFDAKQGGATKGKIAGDKKDGNQASIEEGKKELEKAKKYHYFISARVNQGNIQGLEERYRPLIEKKKKYYQGLQDNFIEKDEIEKRYNNPKSFNRFRPKPESLAAYKDQLQKSNQKQIDQVNNEMSELNKNKAEAMSKFEDQNEYGQNNIAKEYVSGYAPYIKKGGSEKPEIVRAYLPNQSFYRKFEVDPQDSHAVRTPFNIDPTSILPRKPNLNDFIQNASIGHYENILNSLKSSDSYPKEEASYENLYNLLYDSDNEDEEMIKNPIKDLSLSPEKVQSERFTYPRFFSWPEEKQKTGTYF